MYSELDIKLFVFDKCLNLTRKDLPPDCTHLVLTNKSNVLVTKIGNKFLKKSKYLQVVDLSALNQITQIGDKFLVYCKRLIQLNIGTLCITQIGDHFLSCCEKLRNVDLQNINLTQINRGFLSSCEKLEQIDFSSFTNVTQISDGFLYDCEKLQELELFPFSQVTHIGDYFLFGCKNLKTLDLSPLTNVMQIDHRFLFGCKKLKTINFSNLSSGVDYEEMLQYFKEGYLVIPLQKITVNAKTNPATVEKLIEIYPDLSNSLEEQRKKLQVNIKNAGKKK